MKFFPKGINKLPPPPQGWGMRNFIHPWDIAEDEGKEEPKITDEELQENRLNNIPDQTLDL